MNRFKKGDKCEPQTASGLSSLMKSIDLDDVQLIVSGINIRTNFSTLQKIKKSKLSEMFTNLETLKRTRDGAIVLQRDSNCFSQMLDYLRNDRKI